MSRRLKAAALHGPGRVMLLRAVQRCIWCRPSRPTAGWCLVRRLYLKNPTRSPLFRPSSHASISRVPWSHQPTLHAEIESYFATAPAAEVEKVETIDKDHGRFEVRNYSVSHQVDWYAAERSY